MAKYNPENENHRLWLAQNILDLLQKWKFNGDDEHCSIKTWEFVVSRFDKFDPSKKIIVYTGVEKKSGMMRSYASDRIRIIAGKYEDDGEFIPHFRQQLNRTGEFKSINNRVCEAILAAQASKPKRVYSEMTDAWHTSWSE